MPVLPISMLKPKRILPHLPTRPQAAACPVHLALMPVWVLSTSFLVSDYDAYIRSDYAYVGGFYNNLQETGIEAGDYSTVNFKTGVALNQFDLAFYINNLTNEDELTWVDSEGLGARGNRLKPRTLGVSLGYRF